MSESNRDDYGVIFKIIVFFALIDLPFEILSIIVSVIDRKRFIEIFLNDISIIILDLVIIFLFKREIIDVVDAIRKRMQRK